jgi:hypothetical protein
MDIANEGAQPAQSQPELGHGVEVHAPDAGEGRDHREDAGPGREPLVDLVLLDGDGGLAHQDGGVDGIAQGLDRGVDAQQVVIDVAEVVLAAGADGGDPAAEEPAGLFHERRDRVLEDDDLAPQLVELPDVELGRTLFEDAVLDRFELLFEAVEHGEIAVDHLVHQGVQHEAGALAQQFRLALAARPHPGQRLLAAVAHGEDEVPADEDVDLADVDLVGDGLQQVHRHEEGIAVLLDLGALMTVAGILDRQFVQAEFFLHRRQFRVSGVAQRDPDETARPGEIVADFVDRYIGELASFLVGDAVDQHAVLPRYTYDVGVPRAGARSRYCSTSD